MTDTLDIAGINKADLLLELFVRARHKSGVRREMTQDEANALIADRENGVDFLFGYHAGRMLKVDLGGDRLDITEYAQENGEGKAEEAVRCALQRNAQWIAQQRRRKLKPVKPTFKP